MVDVEAVEHVGDARGQAQASLAESRRRVHHSPARGRRLVERGVDAVLVGGEDALDRAEEAPVVVAGGHPAAQRRHLREGARDDAARRVAVLLAAHVGHVARDEDPPEDERQAPAELAPGERRVHVGEGAGDGVHDPRHHGPAGLVVDGDVVGHAAAVEGRLEAEAAAGEGRRGVEGRVAARLEVGVARPSPSPCAAGPGSARWPRARGRRAPRRPRSRKPLCRQARRTLPAGSVSSASSALVPW